MQTFRPAPYLALPGPEDCYIELGDDRPVDLTWSAGCSIKWARTSDPTTWITITEPTTAGYFFRPLTPPIKGWGLGIVTPPGPAGTVTITLRRGCG